MARNEEFINESDLSTDAHELVLHADNTQHLYNQRKAFVDNVARHKKRGNYDEEKGRKLWGYYADRVAQDYHKTYGDKNSKWHHMFPTSTRKEVAAHYEQRFRHGSMDESYVSRNPFAREELHKEFSHVGSCDWCGQKKKLYKYRTESDGGRNSEHKGLFCSKACHNDYHNINEETTNKQTAFQRIKNKLKNRYKKVGKTFKDYKDDLKMKIKMMKIKMMV